MDYNRLVSVTGLGGLYELMSSKADGGIVKSLEDKSTKFVSTRLHNFSHLESIEVFTTKDNVNLVEVFNAMKNSEEVLPDAKADSKAIKGYFEKVYPDMDFERVYGSDMKKMVKWFALLAVNEVEIKLSENHEQDGTLHDVITPKAKTTEPKQASVKTAPPKKINSPRKMA
ncbi:MAG: DUF5606 domain-containing protein [Ferruginibacter sp.]|nr:DUF5606 domain-containing protein [Ferruginibacter sp.]